MLQLSPASLHGKEAAAGRTPRGTLGLALIFSPEGIDLWEGHVAR